MFRATMFTLTLIAAANPGLADEVTDTLSAALQAYEDGDIDDAIEQGGKEGNPKHRFYRFL